MWVIRHHDNFVIGGPNDVHTDHGDNSSHDDNDHNH
jgi:hypothetical protein